VSAERRTWKSELRRAASTMGTFATIVILWALWTAETIDQWLSQMAAYGNMTTEGALLIAGVHHAVGMVQSSLKTSAANSACPGRILRPRAWRN
jgi:hypothetical protein